MIISKNWLLSFFLFFSFLFFFFLWYFNVLCLLGIFISFIVSFHLFLSECLSVCLVVLNDSMFLWLSVCFLYFWSFCVSGLSVRLFVCLSVCLFVCLSVCLFVCLLILNVSLIVCLFSLFLIFLFVHCLFVCLSNCFLYFWSFNSFIVCLSVYLSGSQPLFLRTLVFCTKVPSVPPNFLKLWNSY